MFVVESGLKPDGWFRQSGSSTMTPAFVFPEGDNAQIALVFTLDYAMHMERQSMW